MKHRDAALARLLVALGLLGAYWFTAARVQGPLSHPLTTAITLLVIAEFAFIVVADSGYHLMNLRKFGWAASSFLDRHMRALLKYSIVLSAIVGLVFADRAYVAFNSEFFYLSWSFILVSIGIWAAMFSKSKPEFRTLGTGRLFDLGFVAALAVSVIFLDQSVYYRDLAFFLSISVAFGCLFARSLLDSKDSLTKNRTLFVAEGFFLALFVMLSPYFLNFFPRWWDPYYHYTNIYGIISTGHINAVQTYFGIVSFYLYNAMSILLGFGFASRFLYLVLDSLIECMVVIAIYLLVSKIAGERAGQISLLAAIPTATFTAFIVTPLSFSVAIALLGVYLMARPLNWRNAVLVSFLLVSAFLLHPSGAEIMILAMLLTGGIAILTRDAKINGRVAFFLGLPLLLAAGFLAYFLLPGGVPAHNLLGALGTFTSNPSSIYNQVASQFVPYLVIYYFPLVVPLGFGAYFLATVLKGQKNRDILFLALLPTTFAFVALFQAFTSTGIGETSLTAFIPLAVAYMVGPAMMSLGKNNKAKVALLVIFTLIFFTAMIAPGDNNYFGKANFPNIGSRPFGTAQQFDSSAFFYSLPPGANVTSDVWTLSWGYTRTQFLGQVLSITWAPLSSGVHTVGTYVAYSQESFTRSGVHGNPMAVYAEVVNETAQNDVLYSSGNVTAYVIVR